MKVLFAMIGAALLAGPAEAQDNLIDRWNEDRTNVFDASEVDLDELRWIARPIIVFGESQFEPQFRRQLDLLISEADELATRGVFWAADLRDAGETDLACSVNWLSQPLPER